MKNRVSNVRKSGRAMKVRITATLLVTIMVMSNGLSIPTGTASAAVVNPPITVTTLADENDGVDVGTGTSLREAIATANAAPGEHTINFSVTGTINLTGALPDIIESVEINGPGSNQLTVRRDTGGGYRIFTVSAGTTGLVSFSGLTISNGSATRGGGIINSSGTVNVTDCALSGNAADSDNGLGGGILNGSGTVNITGSTLSGNTAGQEGGGIFISSGTVIVTKSTLSGNSAFTGGGISNLGALVVNGSTLSGNTSDPFAGLGGGIWNLSEATIIDSTLNGNSAGFGSGGGIYHNNGTVNVVNTTLSGNSAAFGGGIFVEPGETHIVNVTNSTLSGNTASLEGGGIWNTGTVNLKSSIVALNTAPIGPDLLDFSPIYDSGGIPANGTFTSQGYNLVGSTSGATISMATADQFDVSAAQLNLGPLQNNGGPTLTHALLPGSVAIDAGISDGLTTDQRGAGFARTSNDPLVTDAPGGDGTDVGAFEVQVFFFMSPIENLPTVNVVNAGSSIPVKFSLGGDKGLNIFAAGYPFSVSIACDFAGLTNDITETVTAGNSSLSYDAATDSYTYVWKTNKGWKNTCRQLVLKMADGGEHRANFRFR